MNESARLHIPVALKSSATHRLKQDTSKIIQPARLYRGKYHSDARKPVLEHVLFSFLPVRSSQFPEQFPWVLRRSAFESLRVCFLAFNRRRVVRQRCPSVRPDSAGDVRTGQIIKSAYSAPRSARLEISPALPVRAGHPRLQMKRLRRHSGWFRDPHRAKKPNRSAQVHASQNLSPRKQCIYLEKCSSCVRAKISRRRTSIPSSPS